MFSLTFTGTIPSEFADSVTQSGFESDYDNNMVYIFRKVNGKWGLNDTISIKAGTDFTLSGSTIKGSAVTQREFPVGDTVAITMRLMHQTKTGDDGVYEPEKIFIGWSNEIKLSKDGNDFDMGELTYKDGIYLMPAPETIVKAQINSTEKITAPYATVVISNAENEEPIVKEEFKFELFSAEYDGEVHYVGIYNFDSTDEFNNLEDGTKLLATINLYEDEARTKSVYENSQGTQFYKKCQTDFYYQLYDDSSESGSSGTGEQILGLNLFDANGEILSSIFGTTFYYAVVITDSAVDDISTASPLFSKVGSSDGSTSLMFRGDDISSILNYPTVYITFGIFETEDEAQTAAKTGEVSNGIYYCKNYPVSIETGTTEQYIDVHLTENSSGSGSSGSGVSEETVTVSELLYNDSSLNGKVFNFSKDGDSNNYFKFEDGKVYWSSNKSTWDDKSSEFEEKGKYIVNWGASYGITETPALSRTSGSGLCSTFSSGEVSCTFTSDGTCSYRFSSEEVPVTFNYTNNGGVIDCVDGFVALYTGSSLYVIDYELNVVE